MRTLLASLCLALVAALPVPAQGQNADDCAKYKPDDAAVKAWPGAAMRLQAVKEAYCGGGLEPQRISFALLGVVFDSAAELEALGIPQATFPFRRNALAAKESVDAGEPIGNMAMVGIGGLGLSFYGTTRVADVAACDSALAKARAAKKVGASDCQELLEALNTLYGAVHGLMQNDIARGVLAHLELSERQWDEFLTKSRSQTSWELLFNSWRWRKDKKPGMFLDPPKMQWIIVHPSVVLEHVSRAADGNRTQEGLMLEVIGANWWQNDKWYQPSGVSYIRLYSDRAGLPDWANGVAVHFANKYTLGATRRDGETGYFLSVDVLELYKDKRALMDGYVGKLKSAVE